MTQLGMCPGLASALALALLVLSSATAAAETTGVVLDRTDRAAGAQAGSRTTSITLTATAVRIDTGPTALVYRKDLNTAWMIDGGSYMVLDRDTTRRIRKNLQAQAGAARAQIDKALAAVPPENRALIEQMMREQQANGTLPGMPGAAAETTPARQPTFTKKQRGAVGEWGCDVYDGHVEGELVQRVCATGIEDLGLTDDDLEVMLYAAEYFWALSKDLGGQAAAPPPDLLGMEEEQGFPGYALSRKRYRDGQLVQESTVTRAERTAFDPALFAKPTLPERKFEVPTP